MSEMKKGWEVTGGWGGGGSKFKEVIDVYLE